MIKRKPMGFQFLDWLYAQSVAELRMKRDLCSFQEWNTWICIYPRYFIPSKTSSAIDDDASHLPQYRPLTFCQKKNNTNGLHGRMSQFIWNNANNDCIRSLPSCETIPLISENRDTLLSDRMNGTLPKLHLTLWNYMTLYGYVSEISILTKITQSCGLILRLKVKLFFQIIRSSTV